ncbi:MAG: pyridoxamine 5'-phosphate oxidase family protein [Candidatus Omnitrophica bacterium]|nr:pyridoxamine 5'-phosphate oxidase family protein [Candidatus Omnitrophota bacterium]
MSSNDLRNEALTIIQNRSIFFMATIDNGIPRVRPMTCLHADGFKIWTCSHKDTAKIEQLKANNMAELCFLDTNNRLLRITGKVTMFDDEKAWADLPIQAQYMPMLEDPNFILLLIEPTHVRMTNDWSLNYKPIPVE